MKVRSKYKTWRSLGINPWDKPWPKKLKHKSPGDHGVPFAQLNTKVGKQQDVDYKTFQFEKKRILSTYSNVKKKQFIRYLENALVSNNLDIMTTNPLHKQLNSRLDSWLFVIGFSKSPFHARQLVNHRKVYVNDQCVTSPSYVVKENDLIQLKSIDLNSTIFPKTDLDLDSIAEINYSIAAAIILKPEGLNTEDNWLSFHLVGEHLK